jgi:hypothetical protein
MWLPDTLITMDEVEEEEEGWLKRSSLVMIRY